MSPDRLAEIRAKVATFDSVAEEDVDELREWAVDLLAHVDALEAENHALKRVDIASMPPQDVFGLYESKMRAMREEHRSALMWETRRFAAAERLARRVVDGIHVDTENISELRALARIVLGKQLPGDFALMEKP